MKFWVMGSQGFIGKALVDVLTEQNYEVIKLSRPEFDLTLPETYPQNINDGDVIIDCIALIDGSPEDIYNVNINGLRKWINYLKSKDIKFKYVYFSTISVIERNNFPESAYIQSKFEAEQLLLSNLASLTIIRLTFPFGIGERKNRLISRLIDKVKNEHPVKIGNITLQLTPIKFLQEHLIEIIQNREGIINFTDGVNYKIEEIVKYLYKETAQPPNYTFDEKSFSDLTVIPAEKFKNSYSTFEEIKRMLN